MMSRRSRPSLKSYTSIGGNESDDNDVFKGDTCIKLTTNENPDMEIGETESEVDEATVFTNTDNVVNPNVNVSNVYLYCPKQKRNSGIAK